MPEWAYCKAAPFGISPFLGVKLVFRCFCFVTPLCINCRFVVEMRTKETAELGTANNCLYLYPQIRI